MPDDLPGRRPLLELDGLVRHFDMSPPLLDRLLGRRGRVAVKAVDGISLAVRRGETLGVVGESGCGKSTVARLVIGLDRPSAGSIRYDGVEVGGAGSEADRRRVLARMQMVFQDPYASLNPGWRVGSIVAEPIRSRRLIAGRGAVEARVAELLTQVGLSPNDRSRFPHEFSGGQRQRISIARALAGQPEFIVCDEPTSALDVSVQAQILNLMKRLQRTLGLTYLFISHDLAVVYHMSTTVAVLYLGRLVELADKHTLFRSPRHPYTRMLLAAVPDLDATGGHRAAPVTGEVANPIDTPAGCPFHPRCPWVLDACKAAPPPLRPVGPGHSAACIRDDIEPLPRT